MYQLDALPLPRPDTWSSDNPHCRVHYQVQAEAEPDLLCRLLNLFALQLLTPLQVQARQHDGRFLIELELDGLSWHRAQVIGEKTAQPDQRLLRAIAVVGPRPTTGPASGGLSPRRQNHRP